MEANADSSGYRFSDTVAETALPAGLPGSFDPVRVLEYHQSRRAVRRRLLRCEESRRLEEAVGQLSHGCGERQGVASEHVAELTAAGERFASVERAIAVRRAPHEAGVTSTRPWRETVREQTEQRWQRAR